MTSPSFPAVGSDGKIQERHLPDRLSPEALAVRTPRILIHVGTGDPVLSSFPDAQVGDLIERLSDGQRWKVEAS